MSSPPSDCQAVRKLAHLGLGRDTIATLLGCECRTLRAFCEGEFLLGQAEFVRDLHAFQYEMAKNHNASMLLWLGKAVLGQKDKSGIKSLDREPIRAPPMQIEQPAENASTDEDGP